MSKIFGIDLSFSNTGYYILQDKPEFGIISSKPAEFNNDMSRINYITDCLMEKIESVKPDLILMEDYFVGPNAFSVTKLVGLGSIMRFKILKSGRGFLLIAPTQLKKFQTGSGKAKKDNMLLSIFKKHGFETTSNDLADACALCYFGDAYLKYLSGDREFLKYELDVLEDYTKKHELIVLKDKETTTRNKKGKKK